jgi:aminopeptidase-like protein
MEKDGNLMYALARRLWPINRSLSGEGVRSTLNILREVIPNLKTKSIPTGQKVFDWEIPREWKVNQAYIINPSGEKICDFYSNNLHLVGYSVPFKGKISLNKLQEHLYSLENQPSAIPYVTSYYEETWGFCIAHEKRLALEEGEYEVFIDAELFNGYLNYGELILPGETSQEVFLSTYICHPSMANNELSGPVVTTFLAKWLTSLEKRKYTYRIIFIPETIGSIAYLSLHKDQLIEKVVAGFNITCVGDDRTYSFLPSKRGDTLSDEVAKHVLNWIYPEHKKFNWSQRGSDERQYCSPHINLPIASIMRTKYGEYEEYHTSLDDLYNVVSPQGLWGGFNALKLALEVLEKNFFPSSKVFCEPQLGRRGLYPTVSIKGGANEQSLMMDLISYSDGTNSLIDIANICNIPVWELYPIVEKLIAHNLIEL